MSTLEEIETAIRLLPPDETEKLLRDLPALFPELGGDAEWARIVHDAQPRPAFSKLIDQIESEHRRNLTVFPELQESDFDRCP